MTVDDKEIIRIFNKIIIHIANTGEEFYLNDATYSSEEKTLIRQRAKLLLSDENKIHVRLSGAAIVYDVAFLDDENLKISVPKDFKPLKTKEELEEMKLTDFQRSLLPKIIDFYLENYLDDSRTKYVSIFGEDPQKETLEKFNILPGSEVITDEDGSVTDKDGKYSSTLDITSVHRIDDDTLKFSFETYGNPEDALWAKFIIKILDSGKNFELEWDYSHMVMA